MARHILQLERPAARHAEARQSRWVHGDDRRLRRDLGAEAERRAHGRIDGGSRVFTLRPVLHADDDHAGTRRGAVGKRREARDGHRALQALDVLHHGDVELVDDGLRAVGRGAIRHLDGCEHVALVLIRDEGRRQILVDDAGTARDDQQEDDRQARVADELRHDADVTALHALEPVVELDEEAAEHALVILLRVLFEHHRAERRRQRQGHEGREADRDGNRQSELPVEDTRHATEEGNRHEDGREDDGDGDDWSLDFIHGALRRIDRRQALFHVLFDILDDDDSIIDDEADGEDHREERQCVDREVEHDERAERTDQGNRNGEQRDDRRAPVLQEDEDDEDDEQQCLEERHENLFDGCADVVRRVEDRRHLHARRQRLLRFIKDLADFADCLHGVCITRELNAEADGRVAIELRNDGFRLGARLDLRDILEADELAVTIRLDDDVAELLRRRQSAFDLAGHLLFLAVVDRHGADRTGRGLDILLLDGRRDIGDRKAQLCELVWVEPDAHRVVGT